MAFVTGGTQSADFPVTANAFQKTPPPAGGEISFVTALQPAGNALFYSSFLGGTGNAQRTTIANTIFVDPAFNAWVAGNTGATDFPVTANAFQPGRKGASDGFFCKIVIAADLKVTLAESVTSISRNRVVGYAARVTNLGPDGSDNVVLTDTIPPASALPESLTIGNLLLNSRCRRNQWFGDLPEDPLGEGTNVWREYLPARNSCFGKQSHQQGKGHCQNPGPEPKQQFGVSNRACELTNRNISPWEGGPSKMSRLFWVPPRNSPRRPGDCGIG